MVNGDDASSRQTEKKKAGDNPHAGRNPRCTSGDAPLRDESPHLSRRSSVP
jgi:hypothetical protein